MSATAVHAIGRTDHRGANDAATDVAEAPRPVRRPIAIPRHARDDPLIGRRASARACGRRRRAQRPVPTSEARAVIDRSNGQTEKLPNQAFFAKNETPPLGRAKTVARASARQW